VDPHDRLDRNRLDVVLSEVPLDGPDEAVFEDRDGSVLAFLAAPVYSLIALLLPSVGSIPPTTHGASRVLYTWPIGMAL
jgi:hypothetical protein